MTGRSAATAAFTDGREPRWPWALVGAAVAWNLVNLEAETLAVSYLNDSSVHEQMVRFAAARIASGHLPLTSWFPYLGLGSPQFLHYQSLPAMLTGLLGLAIGPDPAFRWTLYLLLSAWPVSVYVGARLFGAGRAAAGVSAAMSPFVVGAVGVGYEQGAYVWVGYGLWTQLWASMTLPLAWGMSWRAVRDGRHYLAAAALIALTLALHFETGYLAIAPVLLWPLVAGPPLIVRVRRAALLVAGSLLAGAWVIVPLLAQRDWAASNEVLRGTPLADGYGAPRVLGWLVSGQLLDHGRLPVLTVLTLVGLGFAVARWRGDAGARALVVAFAASLALSFGRATWGPLVDVIPGSADIFFRRFMMGIQLAGLMLAGIGADTCGRAIAHEWDDWTRSRGLRWPATAGRADRWRAGVACAAVIAILAPAWRALAAYDRHNTAAILAQRRAEAAAAGAIDPVIAVVRREGGGRVYAGTPYNWGAGFTVGSVPVFKYLESRDIDEVGYTLRTASLMTIPEYFFDESDPGDYTLFGIHYLILPPGLRPPVPARLILRSGDYCLWRTSVTGYVHVGRIAGHLEANRTDLGVRSIALLHSAVTQAGDFLEVEFGASHPAPLPPLPADGPAPFTGQVTAESDRLQDGEVVATVVMRRPGVVVLSASFDPGWTVTVNGRPRATEMVAPALVGTTLPAGRERVIFRYRGFSGYGALFALCGLSLAGLLAVDVNRRRRTRPGGWR
ncbi:MAG: hypothetical protein ACLP50_25850 [Solirubrobacteraceae bacterium]